MKVTPKTFTTKIPKSTQSEKVYQNALANILEQTDKDAFILKHQKHNTQEIDSKWLERCKKFFGL